MIAVSIIVPVYSGADFLPGLIAEIEGLRRLLEQSGGPCRIQEVILVDDSAIDGSAQVMDELGLTHH